MLSIFRRGIVSKLMLVVLAIGLFAIVITGFGTDGMGGLGGVTGGGSTLASVGGEKVTTTEMQQQMDRQLGRAQQQQPDLDMASFVRAGAFDQILNQLISSKALTAFAHRLGFGVDKIQVDTEIANIPAFRNQAGRFDNVVFRQQLAQQNLSEAQLREEIETGLLQQQLLAPVALGARIPEGMALQYANLLLERRSGSIGVVPSTAFTAGADPTNAQVEAYYKQNAARYTVPERRVISYALITPAQAGDAAQVTPQEIQAFYRQNAATYAGTETRTLSQVVLPTREAAQTFAQKLGRGTSFDQAAAEAGFGKSDTSLGAQSRDQFTNLTSPAVANAAFSAAQGATTQPLQSEFGWHVVRVDSINRTAARTLEQVQDEIREQLSAQKQQTALADFVTKVEDQIAEGGNIAEIARAQGLTLQKTPPVTASGNVEGGQLAPEIAPLLQGAFDLTADDDPAVQPIGPNGFALIDVDQIIPAAPAPLAQVRDRVRADFIAQRASDQARKAAEQIVAKVNGGTPIAQAFAQSGVNAPAIQPVDARRIDIAQGGQVPPPLAMMFSMKKGTAKLLQAPQNGGWFVVYLANTEAGNAAGETQMIAATRTDLSNALSNELIEQFVKAVEREEKIKRNDKGIASFRQQLLQAGALPAQ